MTPLQLLNRATDPFLAQVKAHTFAVLEDLDARGLRNHVLVITRCPVSEADCERLAALSQVRLTLLFTYSGIADQRIEPYPSHVAAGSLKTASGYQPRRYRTVLYWRPLVPGLNDSPGNLAQAAALSVSADATVFTGLFFRDEIAAYYRANDLPVPYGRTARRKIMPETLEQRVLAAFGEHGSGRLFRKTSCAVSYGHGLPDYNGHVGIRQLCDICPGAQLAMCLAAHQVPTVEQVKQAASALPEAAGLRVVDITDRAVVVDGLVHDAAYPHRPRRHGRAEIGWEQA